jgi:hypothetical protein
MTDKINVVWKQEEPRQDEVYHGSSVRMATRENFSSYVDHQIEIVVKTDGEIYFSADDGESFIYFYPDQLSLLKYTLDVALLQRKGETQ